MHAFYHGFFCRTIAFALLCVLLHFILHSCAAWLEPPFCKGFRPDSSVFDSPIEYQIVGSRTALHVTYQRQRCCRVRSSPQGPECRETVRWTVEQRRVQAACARRRRTADLPEARMRNSPIEYHQGYAVLTKSCISFCRKMPLTFFCFLW